MSPSTHVTVQMALIRDAKRGIKYAADARESGMADDYGQAQARRAFDAMEELFGRSYRKGVERDLTDEEAAA